MYEEKFNRTDDKPYECPPPNRWDFAYLLPFIPSVVMLIVWWS